MAEMKDMEMFLEYMPAFSIWYKALLIYLFQFFIFISVMIFFLWISSVRWYGALIGEFIVVFCGIISYMVLTINIDNIRDKYLERHGKLAAQRLWYYYESYTIPLLSSSLYLPLLLKTDYFLPALIDFPSHFMTLSLFPVYIALPLGVFIIIFGLLIRRPSGGFGADVETYLYLLYPEKGRLITEGIYRYVRHPRYLSRGLIVVGFGVIANNLLAICVGLIHFMGFCLLIKPEDNELVRRFGDVFIRYCSSVPALFPRFGTWKDFIKLVFLGSTPESSRKKGKNYAI